MKLEGIKNRNTDVQAQMLLARSILNRLQKISPTAVIAGGAPRDWYLDKVASDIDIFYYQPERSTHANDLKNLLFYLQHTFPEGQFKILGLDLRAESANQPQVQVEAFNNYMLNPNIRHVFETTLCGQTVQFICMLEDTLDVSTFAYNICQTWSDGVDIYGTELFKLGMNKKILIETGDLFSDASAYKQKIIQKFPDFDYVQSNIAKRDLHCKCCFFGNGVSN